MTAPHLITADELAQWGGTKPAESLLPELMQRLVRSEASVGATVRFRTGKGIHQGGFDGEVVSTDIATDHVPAGNSVWEVSTVQNATKAKAKATSDLKRRSDATPSNVKAQATYVAVSLERLDNETDWTNAQPGHGWREIRRLDVDGIYEWLCACPEVHFWLSAQLGHDVLGVRSLLDWWDDWSRVTTPTFGLEWLKAGRAAVATEVAEAALTRQLLCLQGPSEDEALAFLASVLLSSEDPEVQRLATKTLVIEDIRGGNYLSNVCHGLLLVAKCDTESSHHGLLLKRNRLVVLQLSRPDKIVLPSVNLGELAKLLEADGLPIHEAHDAAAAARNSVEHLRHKLGAPTRFFVQIAKAASDHAALTAILLANRWSDIADADQGVVSELAGSTYAEVQRLVKSLPVDGLPLVRRSGHVLFLTDAPEAWRQLGEYASSEVLERFRTTITKVLAEHDPAFELPATDRWQSGLLGKSPKYSEHLKEGVARTLGLLATQNPTLRNGESGQGFASNCVRSLLADATPERWYSLGPLLALLAEAAPSDFLTILEEDLDKEVPCSLEGLLVEDEDALTSGSRHPELLWALERLAWSREHLLRVSLILARLAERWFGKTGNNPHNSLKEIFRPWHPCTQATVSERIQIIDAIRQRYPNVGWTLLLEQLPEHHATAMPTSKPDFRPWAEGGVEPQLISDIVLAGQEALTRAIVDAGNNAGRWAALARSLMGLNLGWNEIFLNGLEAAVPAIGVEDRLKLWRDLHNIWRHHSRHPNAEWAMNHAAKARLESIMTVIVPDDPADANVWLFEQWVDLPEPWQRDSHNYEKDRVKVSDLRRDAVKAIFDRSGTQGVIDFAGRVEAPMLVGRAAAELHIWTTGTEATFLAENLRHSERGRDLLAVGYAISQFENQGFDWLLRYLSEECSTLRPDQQVSLLLIAKAARATWEVLEGLGPEAESGYWSRIHHWALPTAGEDRNYALNKLLLVGREIDVIDLLADAHRGQDGVQAEMAFAALEQLREDVKDKGTEIARISTDLADLFDALTAQPDVDLQRLAALEFFFTPVMSILRAPAALGKALASEPKLLVDMISLTYLAEDEAWHEASAHEAALASAAWRVLNGWNILPATNTDGSLDGKGLLAYVQEARKLAASPEVKRLAVMDLTLARVLSHSPSDADGSWPHSAVRNVVEEVKSTTLEDGLITAIFNNRGVTSRGPYEGGRQERDLQAKYQALAAKVRFTSPRTAAMLDKVSERYGDEAKRMDERAAMAQDLRV